MIGEDSPSQPRSQAPWSIPFSHPAGEKRPQPRRQESQINSQRRSEARWSPNRSRWSVSNDDLEEIEEIEEIENPKPRLQKSQTESQGRPRNRLSQTRSRWSIPIGNFAENSGPQPRQRMSQIDLERRAEARWSQTRSRWSIPVADLVNRQVIPSLPPGKQKRGKSWHFLIAFFALAVVAFTSALDATALSIALPIVAKDLGGTSLESFWAGISFLLTSALFQPLCTSCSDIFGRKPVLYICIGIFGLGSIIFGVAKSMKVLILGRTVQGIGGGGLEALCEIILTDMTTLKERALWIGILGFVWAAGSVLGPLVGGVFSEYVTWRWIAWINLPLLGIAVVLIPPFLTLRPIKLSMKEKLRQLDYIGILLFISGMTSFVIAITWGGVLFPWASWKTLLPLILGIVVILAFVVYESQPAEPMIPYRILTNKNGAIALVGAFLHGMILFGVVFYLPIYFEGVIGDKPLRGAVEALPLSFTVMPFAIITAFGIDYVRKYCWAIWTGWILTTVGMGLMSLLALSSSQASRSGLQVVAGIGLGILYPALSIPMQASVKVDDNGLAIGTFVFARQLGSIIGLALGSAIFTNVFKGALPAILPEQLQGLIGGNDAINYISILRSFGLDLLDLEPTLQAYSKALRGVWYAMTAIGGVALLASLFMTDMSLENESTGKQAFNKGDESVQELISMDNQTLVGEEQGQIVASQSVQIPLPIPTTALVLAPIDTAPDFTKVLDTKVEHA